MTAYSENVWTFNSIAPSVYEMQVVHNVTNQGNMSNCQLPKLRRTILAKVLRNLVTNESKAVTTIPEPQPNTILQQL